MKTTIGKQIREGILTRNPVLVQLLGLTPALAITTSVINAVGMGAAVTAVLACSCLFISLIRRLLPKQITAVASLAVIGGFTTAAELLMEAYFPALSLSLGLFIPLIAVNCAILCYAEEPALKLSPIRTLVGSIATGIGFTLSLVCIGAVRELFGTGRILAAADGTGGFALFGASYTGITMLLMPAGALILLGFILALVQKLSGIKIGESVTDISEINEEEEGENE